MMNGELKLKILDKVHLCANRSQALTEEVR